VNGLKQIRWESEDGESKKGSMSTLVYWDSPLCWTGDDKLAVWGYGEDDEWLIPAVRLLNANSGSEVAWFAGPEIAAKDGATWRDTSVEPDAPLVFDKSFFAVQENSARRWWDVERGYLLLEDPFVLSGSLPFRVAGVPLATDGNAFQLSRLVA